VTRLNWGTIIPQVAVVAPLVAFAFDGTAVPIGEMCEELLRWATWPVLASVAWALGTDSRFWRVVSGASMIVWWGVFIGVLISITNPRTSTFGLLSLAAIPVVIAFTWGHLWGIHDIQRRTGETDER
jgi:hypothetical protein